MPAVLPAPAFLARLTATRRAERDVWSARADKLGFMGLARELATKCGETLNNLAALQPRARTLYQTRPEYRDDLRARWRRHYREAFARWLGPAKALALEAALVRGERVAIVSASPAPKCVGALMDQAQLGDLGPSLAERPRRRVVVHDNIIRSEDNTPEYRVKVAAWCETVRSLEFARKSRTTAPDPGLDPIPGSGPKTPS